MSQPIRWSVSVDKETDAIAEILQRMYAEFVGENRSRLVQFIVKRWYRLSMAGKLPAALEAEQGINQAILSEEITTFNNSSQNEFPSAPHTPLLGPKPLTRVTPSSEGARRRHVSGVSRRSCVAGMEPWNTSFHIHFTRLNERVA